MKKDIILCGVGGQGILSIATVIGEAATAAGINLKQAEVHGMSQRGGDVQSNLRLSTEPVWSDLIPSGGADIIISMEPMEALRYTGFLNRDSVLVTSTAPFRNIPDYPDIDAVIAEMDTFPKVVKADIEKLARENAMPRSANMILLGMAAAHIEIISPEELKSAIARVFASKGAAVVESNVRAFEIGMKI